MREEEADAVFTEGVTVLQEEGSVDALFCVRGVVVLFCREDFHQKAVLFALGHDLAVGRYEAE